MLRHAGHSHDDDDGDDDDDDDGGHDADDMDLVSCSHAPSQLLSARVMSL